VQDYSINWWPASCMYCNVWCWCDGWQGGWLTEWHAKSPEGITLILIIPYVCRLPSPCDEDVWPFVAKRWVYSSCECCHTGPLSTPCSTGMYTASDAFCNHVRGLVHTVFLYTLGSDVHGYTSTLWWYKTRRCNLSAGLQAPLVQRHMGVESSNFIGCSLNWLPSQWPFSCSSEELTTDSCRVS
jgi:hypothetical protein